MTERHYEGQDHAKLYQAYRPTTPKPLIDRVIQYLKEKFEGPLNLCVDVGCGSGQNTIPYADHFDKVIGVDVSPSQIEQAQKHNPRKNVFFEVSGAEKLNLPEQSVQLITAMAAVHWFDIPKFFEEVERVLCSRGVLAVYTYRVEGIQLSWDKNPAKNKRLSGLFSQDANWKKPIDTFIPPNAQLALRKYRDITLPFEDCVRDEDTFYHERKVNVAGILGQIQTWSAFPRMKEELGTEAAQKCLDELQAEILDIIGDDLKDDTERLPQNIYFVEKDPLVLLMGRKAG